MSAGFSFGTGGTGGFSFSTLTSTTTSTSSTPSTGFSFLTPSSVASTSGSTTNTLGGLKFSGFSTAATTSSSALTSSSLNFNLNSSTNTTTTTSSGGTAGTLFNVNPSTSAPSLGAGNLNFGKLPGTALATTTGLSSNTLSINFASSNSSTSTGTGSSVQSSFGPVASLTTATTTSSVGGSGAGGATNLSMRQLEERLNKWLVELKEQEERFVRQAAHVNAWDQILQNGHDQVQSLKDTLHTVKSDQSRLEAEIDFIRGQQEELERLLDPLESATNVNPATQLHQGDRQRDNMYYLAQSLDAQLRQMTEDLGKVIEHLNTSSGPWQPNDPVTLVARILSAHMDTLKWVDQNTALLSQKIEEVSRVTANVGKRG